MRWSGGHRAVIRSDGQEHKDERHPRMTFGGLVDYIIPIAIIGLLAWLLKNSSDNNALLATLVERTGNLNKVIEGEREDRLSADKFLQSELDEVRMQSEKGRR